MKTSNHGFENADEWYGALVALAQSLSVVQLVRDREAWIEAWGSMTPEEAFFNEFPEYVEGN